MNRPLSSPDHVADAAAAWLARHDRGLTPDEAREFTAWRDADLRHAEEFAQLMREWNDLTLAKADPALAAMAQELDERTRPAATWPTSVWLRAAWFGGLAAAALVTVAAVLEWRQARNARSTAATAYQVVPSDAREMRLPDGSRVALRGGSEVAVAYTDNERRVRLLHGEAQFTVAKDPARPFIVSAGTVAVHAIGTVFNVRLDATAVDVLVTEGKVGVDRVGPAAALRAEPPSLHLIAGERTSIALAPDSPVAPAEVVRARPAEMEHILSWQSTRLVFNRTPLAEAVAAFNRHGPQRLALGDVALRDRLLGGTFRADNVEAFVRLLEQGDGIRAERRADGTTVLWVTK